MMTKLMIVLFCALVVQGTPGAWDSLEVGATADIGDAWGTPESWGAPVVEDILDEYDWGSLKVGSTAGPRDIPDILKVGGPQKVEGSQDDQLQGTFDPRDHWEALEIWGTPSVGSTADVWGSGVGGTPLPAVEGVPAIRPSFHIVSKGTDLTVTCSISNINETVDVVWSYKGLDIDYSVDNDGGIYRIDQGIFSKGSQITTLTIDSSVNLEDSKYMCRVEEEGQVVASGTVTVFLFVVTPVHAQVAANARATLSCVFTDIIKNLTVTWELGGNDLSSVDGYTIVMGTNIHFRQVSTLTIAPKHTDISKNYTCTIYPTPSPTWSTVVRLEVVPRSEVVPTAKGHGLSPVYIAVSLCLFVSWVSVLLY